jgi:hypothetical protein
LSIFDTIAAAESGNRNVANTTATTSSGQAQGFYQITTGTWHDFAPQAGVDLAQYPTPLSAPQGVQQQVAGYIPLNRWAPSTVAAVQSAYGPVDTGQTVGNLDLTLGGFSGQSPLAGHPTTSDPTAVNPTIDVGGPSFDPSIPAGQQGSEFAPAGSTGGGSNLGAAQPGYVPPAATGGPAAFGLTTGLAGFVTQSFNTITGGMAKAFSDWLSSLENWVGRGFLILIGLVIVAIALWRILAPDVSVADIAHAATMAA